MRGIFAGRQHAGVRRINLIAAIAAIAVGSVEYTIEKHVALACLRCRPVKSPGKRVPLADAGRLADGTVLDVNAAADVACDTLRHLVLRLEIAGAVQVFARDRSQLKSPAVRFGVADPKLERIHFAGDGG